MGLVNQSLSLLSAHLIKWLLTYSVFLYVNALSEKCVGALALGFYFVLHSDKLGLSLQRYLIVLPLKNNLRKHGKVSMYEKHCFK